MLLKKLVFINRCYWPDSEATGQLLTELCEFDSDVMLHARNLTLTKRSIYAAGNRVASLPSNEAKITTLKGSQDRILDDTAIKDLPEWLKKEENTEGAG